MHGTIEKRYFAVASEPRSRPFGDHASRLIELGYSPLPILPASKAPALRGWQRHAVEPLSPDQLARFSRSPLTYGVGLACGYLGLVAIDVDSDDPAVLAALRPLAPRPIIAKRGKKGVTLFARGAGIVGRKFKGHGQSKPLVEILARGQQTVVPPTLHPYACKPYEWLSGRTRLDTPIADLPEITRGWVDELGEALRPFLPEPPPLPPTLLRRHSGPLPDWQRLLIPMTAIPADSREEWIKVGMALHHESGGSPTALAAWCDWSRGASSHEVYERGGCCCSRAWRSFRPGRGCNGGTVFNLARRYGWQGGRHGA